MFRGIQECHVNSTSALSLLARVLSVACEAGLLVRLTTEAICDSDQFQSVGLRPLNQPRREILYGRRVRLMHEGNMAVSAGSRLLERLFALVRRPTIPVLRVDIVCYRGVSERGKSGKDLATGVKVGGSHVGRLDADEVGEGLVEALHLLGDLIGTPLTHALGVRPCQESVELVQIFDKNKSIPCVRGDLVAGSVSLLDLGRVVVDAAVKRAGPEEGCFGPGRIENIDQLRSEVVWAVIVGESENTGSVALCDDGAALATEEVDGRGKGSGGAGQNTGQNSSGANHFDEFSTRNFKSAAGNVSKIYTRKVGKL